MLDPITRTAALLALAYRGQARFIAACHAEVAALAGDSATEKAWRRVSDRLGEIAARRREGRRDQDRED